VDDVSSVKTMVIKILYTLLDKERTMPDLDAISAADLRTELDQVESKAPALRLVVGLNYKYGATQTEIAEQYGLSRKTVYNWLKRLETQPIEQAIVDAERPGRPPKLSGPEREGLTRALRQTPKSVDYAASGWTPPVVKQFIAERFDVEYSLPHVRRLMREVGLSPGESTWTLEKDRSDRKG
jgi:transposase